MWKDEQTFRLRDTLLQAAVSARHGTDELSMFESTRIPEIDPDQLAYFGVSIFWRAAVRDWEAHAKQGGPVFDLAFTKNNFGVGCSVAPFHGMQSY